MPLMLAHENSISEQTQLRRLLNRRVCFSPRDVYALAGHIRIRTLGTQHPSTSFRDESAVRIPTATRFRTVGT